jgi:hypothetical protein
VEAVEDESPSSSEYDGVPEEMGEAWEALYWVSMKLGGVVWVCGDIEAAGGTQAAWPAVKGFSGSPDGIVLDAVIEVGCGSVALVSSSTFSSVISSGIGAS